MNVGELCTIRHRLASGHVDEWFEFLPAAGGEPERIIMSVSLGSAEPVVCTVPVCTHRSRKEKMLGRWVLVRKDDQTFVLTAARMPTSMDCIAHSEAFHEDLPVGSVMLTHAPPDVARAMGEI